jgi:HSP20 family protein
MREPLTDVIEEKERIRIIVELPGVNKEDIHLNATEEILDIMVESPDRRFSKHLDLPSNVDPDSATASYNNGVLEICLARVEKQQKGKSIDIN